MGQQKDELEIESYTPHDTGALEIESYVPLKPEPIHAQGFTMPETVRVTSPGQHDIELPPAPPPEATAQGPIQPLPLVSTRPEDMLQAPAGPIKPPRPALTVSRTGEGPSEQRYTRSDAAAELTGIPQMERGAVNLAIQSFTPPPPGTPEPYENFSEVPSHGTVTDKQAAAVSDIVEGFFKFTTPFVGAAAVRAPGEVAYGVFKAVVASKLGEKAAEELGATKEGQRLVGNIAALVTGSKAANDVIDTITADTARLVKKQAQALTLAGQLSGSGFSTGDVPGYRAPSFGEHGVPDNPAYSESRPIERPTGAPTHSEIETEIDAHRIIEEAERKVRDEESSPAPAAPALEASTQQERNAQARAEAETQPPAYRDLAAVEQGRALERRVRAGVSPTGEERRQPELAIDHVDVTPAETEEHKFSNTQINLPPAIAEKVVALAKTIPDDEIEENGRAGDTPATAAHVTVKYGLHTDDVEKVKEVLKDEPPIKVTLGALSIFPDAESKHGDVVKADVDSPDLHRLNAKIADALEHTDTHPTYRPHVTVAYVKAGEGKKYVGNESLKGETATVDTLTFSSKDGKIYEIPLTGPKTLSIPAPPAGRPGSAFVKLTDEQLRTVVDKGGMAAPAARLELDRRSGGIGPEEYAQRLERLSGGARSALKEDSAPVQEIDWHRVKPRAVTLSKSYTINSNGNRFQTVLVTDREGRKHRYDIKVREGRDGAILSNFDAKQQALQQYKADVQSGKIVHAEIQPGGTETSGSRGAQPPREGAVPRRVREAGAPRRPIIDRYDKAAIDGLVAEAKAGGFNGDAIDLERQLRDRFQLLEDVDRATATDDPLIPHRQLLRIAASLEAIPFERGGHWQNLKGDRFEEGYTYRAGGDPIYTTITQLAGARATRAEVLTAIRGRLQNARLTTKQASIADAAERVAQAIVDGKLAIGTVKIQGPMLPPDAGVDTVALVQRLKDGLGEQWWTTIGSVPLIDDAREAGDEGDISFNTEEFEPQPVVDTLDTGEEQPRLPEAGVVRDQNVETPAFEAPFSLSSEAADVTGAQDSLFGSGPTERGSEPPASPPEAPTPPKSDPKREALIEKIVAASRDAEPDIVERIEVKGTDGKWYDGQANSLPVGVRSTGERRTSGYAIRTSQGTFVGTRQPTREALLERWRAAEDKKAEEFREHLQAESDERLQSQASYWLKTAMQPGLAGHDAFMERLRDGNVNPHDLREAFKQTLEERAKLTAQLSGLTKADLLKRFGRYGAERWKNDKKAAIVEAAYRDLLQDFVLSESLSYNPMAKGGFEAAVRAQVENATEETIADYAKRIAEQRAAYKKRVEGYVKAIKNPETLDEYDTFVRAHKEGEAGLTPEQRVKYDELRAAAGRTKREAAQAQRSTVQTASAKVGVSIVETKHTRDNYDLFVVQLDQRVERDDYNRFNEAAKKLGGWYSSYRKGGAVPGFQFKTREAAETFKKFVTEGDTEAVKEAATERRSEKREAKKNAAAERLAEMADRLEGSAEESLSADRLANTERRARMAASAEARARAEIAMARTLRSLAEAIESGDATHLDGIRTKAQVESLEKIATQAKWDALREQYPEHRDFEKHKDRPVQADDIEFARYPVVYADRDDLLRVMKTFPNTRVAMRAKALLRRFTTGANKAEVPKDLVAEAVAKDEELGKRGILSWTWAARQTEQRRLETAGIPDLPTLRAALREFIAHRGEKPAEDKVKKLERELAGNNGVGIDFFPTPEDLALRMADALDLQKGMRVLEPSAGNGNLADAVMQVQPEAIVETVEQSSTLRNILDAKGYSIVGHDFMDFEPSEPYDRVIMNPPFSDGQDADHVRRAYEMLKPGGRLVAIAGEGIFFRDDKKAKSFRDWFGSVRGQSEKLEGAFTDRREVKTTSVNSRLLVIDKPAAAEKPKPKDEGGTTLEMAIIPGARQFAEYVVEPAVRTAAEAIAHDVKVLQRVMAPATVSPEAMKASGTMRAHFAAKDQLIGRLHKNHAKIAAMMDGWSHDQSLAFWDVMQGRAAPSTLPPDIRQIADAFRDILNFWTKQVRDRDLIRRYLDHYWPQEWKRADTVIARIMGRRPLAGRESFRKRRTIPSTREGVEDYGLEPVTWNPARQLERKVAEMARSVMAYDIRRDLTKQGFRKFAAAPKKAPAGWVQDKDRGVVYGPQTFTTASGEEARIPFGRLVVGHYYLQPDVARLLENHLSPGWWGQSVLFDAYRVLGNLSTQVLLGWSSFHLWMTGLESIVSKQSVAAELLARGDVVRAAKMQRWAGPHGLVRDLFRGYQAVKTFYADVADANDVSGIIGQIVNAGGGFNWTEFEHTNAPEKFMTDLRSLFGALKRMDMGEVAKATAKGVLHGPLAAIELPTHLIMTHWVPYLKASAFLDLAEAELARLPHNASLEEKRIVLGRAWDTIDDRLGQLRYDNLFWNRTFQQVLTGSFLSVGWNLGSLRAGMMAVPAQIGTVRRKLAGGGPPPRGPRSRQFEGPRPEGEPLRTDLEPLVHRRMVWLFMGALIVALLGALRQYLMTGKPPEGMKDLYAPRNGKVDDNGREERDVLISYAKDYYDWLHHPTSTLGHKLKPFLTMLYETYANEDFFGNALRDPHDPWYEQTADVLTHWLARERPIAWTNAEKRAGPNATAAQKLAEWGKLQAEPFTPAAAEVERGAAENYLRSVNPPTPHTEASAEQMQARLKLRSALRAKEPGAIAEAMKEGVLSKRSVQHTRKTVADTSLQRSFTAAPIGDALEAYELATPNERQQLRVRLVKKYQSALKTLPATQRSGVIQRYREALTLPLATR